MIEHDALSVLLGGFIGAILALTGAGGGIIAVPVLIFGLGLSMNQAAPIALLAVGLSASIGALLGLRQRVVRYRAAAAIAAVGVAVAPLGISIAQRVPNAPLALAFAVVLMGTCLRMLHEAIRGSGNSQQSKKRESMACVLNPVGGRLRWTLPCFRALTFTGLLSGMLSGLLGVGGGFVIVPALTRCTNLDTKSITATSLAVIALVSSGSVVGAALTSTLNWQIGIPFAAGAVLGLIGGRHVADHLAGPRLQQAFSVTGIFAAALLAHHALSQ